MEKLHRNASNGDLCAHHAQGGSFRPQQGPRGLMDNSQLVFPPSPLAFSIPEMELAFLERQKRSFISSAWGFAVFFTVLPLVAISRIYIEGQAAKSRLLLLVSTTTLAYTSVIRLLQGAPSRFSNRAWLVLGIALHLFHASWNMSVRALGCTWEFGLVVHEHCLAVHGI